MSFAFEMIDSDRPPAPRGTLKIRLPRKRKLAQKNLDPTFQTHTGIAYLAKFSSTSRFLRLAVVRLSVSPRRIGWNMPVLLIVRFPTTNSRTIRVATGHSISMEFSLTIVRYRYGFRRFVAATTEALAGFSSLRRKDDAPRDI